MEVARSGDIGDNEETWLETTVEGTGTIRFDRKVSSDGSDSLSFRVDGQYQAGWTSGGWDEYFCLITTGGTHTLRWTYTKGSSGSGGSDCAWVDHVRWSGDLPDPNGWQEIAYTYDPTGRRIEKAVEGQTQVKYLYDGDHCIAEYDANDTLLRKYIHGPGVDAPICMIEEADAGATYYYHFDGMGIREHQPIEIGRSGANASLAILDARRPRTQRSLAPPARHPPLTLQTVGIHDVLEHPGVSNGKGDFLCNRDQQKEVLFDEHTTLCLVQDLQHPDQLFPRHQGNGNHISRPEA